MSITRTLPHPFPVTAASKAMAEALGLGRGTVRRWVRQAEVDSGAQPGVTSEEHAEINRLETENQRPREDNEILKSSLILFKEKLDLHTR